MSTTFLLIRHGMTEAIGRFVAGRMAGVHLTDEGRRQAEALPSRLVDTPVAAIYSSPLERTRETAEPLARSRGLDVFLSESFSEIHYGEWTGRRFEELDPLPEWRRYNAERAVTRIPGGETYLEVQTRMVTAILDLKEKHAGETVAVFSHGDPIKALIAYHLGISVEQFRRIEISPASISVLGFRGGEVRLHCLNTTGDRPLTHFE
jgi:probable phosphomutase (TIGR03848 family)